jgi:hypothetical protein
MANTNSLLIKAVQQVQAANRQAQLRNQKEQRLVNKAIASN